MIDPVLTGYSRPDKPELSKRFLGVQEDIASVGEFIRMYLTMEQRWLSPIFVLGESYGGIRGSGLAQWLTGNGVGLNGLVLVSPYLNGNVQDGGKANGPTLCVQSSDLYRGRLVPQETRAGSRTEVASRPRQGGPGVGVRRILAGVDARSVAPSPAARAARIEATALHRA